ncbi:unnamed protein product [Caenorhabditis sp. 36 PRJEB53466]|nr:unnamed protein product [Caenorhabditis sp. 36 PRJEB53466]
MADETAAVVEASAQEGPMDKKPAELKYRVKSNDGLVFEMSPDALYHSNTLAYMTKILDLTVEKAAMEDPINLYEVNASILVKVIEWCTKHQDKAPKREFKDDPLEISQWDAEFLERNRENVFELMMAADYLDIAELISLATQFIANVGIGKTADELKNYRIHQYKDYFKRPTLQNMEILDTDSDDEEASLTESEDEDVDEDEDEDEDEGEDEGEDEETPEAE